jgi:hypothetical protein
MPTASTRPPDQDLLITYLQNKAKQRMLVDQGVEAQKRKSETQPGSPTAKQKATVKQDLVPFHEQQIASASGAASSSEEKRGRGRPRSRSVQAEKRREHQQFKEQTAELQGVKTKAKVQEIYSDSKMFTSKNYNAWEALSDSQLLHQLETYYGMKRRWLDKNTYKYRNDMLRWAEDNLELVRSKPTPQDS